MDKFGVVYGLNILLGGVLRADKPSLTPPKQNIQLIEGVWGGGGNSNFFGMVEGIPLYMEVGSW